MLLQIASSAIAAGCLGYYSPYIGRLAAVRTLRQKVVQKRTLVLTYDDGPSETITPQVLALLRRHDARATFFLLGRSAQKYNEIARRVVDEGHEVGCHGDQHLNAWKVTPWRAVSDINIGYDHLASLVAPNGLYRPPYGKMTVPTLLAVLRRHATVGWWTLDTRDSHGPLPTPQDVVDRFIRENGGVVLMHDTDRTSAHNAFVLETTARLLKLATQYSFQIKTLGELQQ